MKDNRLTILIERSADQVFDFALNPVNTPKWVNSIKEEVASEQPTKLGTVYTNWSQDSKESVYVITELIKNKSFALREKNGSYQVRYTFLPIAENLTKFEYYEWTEQGDLENPFYQPVLEQLKAVIES